MKLTSREQDLVVVAIDEALDAGLYKETKIMLDEYAELRLKLKSRKSTEGNTIIDGFIMDCDGNQADKEYSRLLKTGFRQWYYGAQYHWGVISPAKLLIATYTEGDVKLIICNTKAQLVKEVKAHFKFFRDDGYESKGFFDVQEPELMKEINKESPAKLKQDMVKLMKEVS